MTGHPNATRALGATPAGGLLVWAANRYLHLGIPDWAAPTIGGLPGAVWLFLGSYGGVKGVLGRVWSGGRNDPLAEN